MKNGLSNNSVKAIAQDEDGFLWFGTEEGLNRFDGERFTSFSQPDGKGIPSDDLFILLALPGHRLLLGTFKGLCILDTRKLEFAPVNLLNQGGLPGRKRAIRVGQFTSIGKDKFGWAPMRGFTC